MNNLVRIIFAGTEGIAEPAFDVAFHTSDMCAALTMPDKPVGRKRELQGPKIKQKALACGVPVLQPEKLDSTVRSHIEQYKPDLLVSASYGKIFGPKFMSLFPLGGINVHPSLLPRYRGPNPIRAAILSGDIESGVCIQRLAAEMDSGDILAVQKTSLPADIDTPQAQHILGEVGAELLREILRDMPHSLSVVKAQNHNDAIYCRKVHKWHGMLTWREPSWMIHRMVRAYYPFPGVRVQYKKHMIKLLETELIHNIPKAKKHIPGSIIGRDSNKGILVATVDGVLGIKRLQREGKKAMVWDEFVRGSSLLDEKSPFETLYKENT